MHDPFGHCCLERPTDGLLNGVNDGAGLLAHPSREKGGLLRLF
jgi:hypothetical protein